VSELGVKIQSLLVGDPINMDPGKAAKYALLCMDVYRYINDHPEMKSALQDANNVRKGVTTISTAVRYAKDGAAIGITSAANGFRSYGIGGGGKIISAFVNQFAAYAEKNGIELNQCALSITKVALDIGTAGAGAVTSVTGAGIVFLAIGVLGTFNDSGDMAKACGWT
jgi:hypothetical protein